MNTLGTQEDLPGFTRITFSSSSESESGSEWVWTEGSVDSRGGGNTAVDPPGRECDFELMFWWRRGRRRCRNCRLLGFSPTQDQPWKWSAHWRPGLWFLSHPPQMVSLVADHRVASGCWNFSLGWGKWGVDVGPLWNPLGAWGGARSACDGPAWGKGAREAPASPNSFPWSPQVSLWLFWGQMSLGSEMDKYHCYCSSLRNEGQRLNGEALNKAGNIDLFYFYKLEAFERAILCIWKGHLGPGGFVVLTE